MGRNRPVDYAGAAGRCSLADAAALGARWVLQPKVDGCYARAHLDGRGRIERVLSRTGAELERSLVGHLLGALVGWPGSVLVGELEAHTEAGNRAAATRGWRALHLFDCVRAGARYLGREPYSARRDAMWRMQSEVVNLGLELPWAADEHGARDRASGQWCEAVPTDWRLTPIVAQRPAAQASLAWADVERNGAEGLVAVAVDASLGARGAKRKIKATSTLDCRVLSAGGGVARVEYGGAVFVVSARGQGDELEPGDIVEVAHDGWYEAGSTPRFARLLRRRADLAA